jgi:hypothetical protein
MKEQQLNIIRKQVNKKHINLFYWQLFFLVIGILSSIYCFRVYKENLLLEKNGKVISLKIIDRACTYTGSRSRWVNVIYKGKIYRHIELPSIKSCLLLKDTISLIYNKKSDCFYLPGSLNLYKKYLYGSILIVLLSVLPWNKINKVVNTKRN